MSQLEWQHRAQRVLGELLELADAETLPVIDWTVSSAEEGLLGWVSSRDPAVCQADFTAWHTALGAEPHSQYVGSGLTRLRAVAEWGDEPVQVRLAASLQQYDPD